MKKQIRPLVIILIVLILGAGAYFLGTGISGVSSTIGAVLFSFLVTSVLYYVLGKATVKNA